MSPPTIEEAIQKAIGEPSWWDWYEIGGRWEGSVESSYPEAKMQIPNVLRCQRNPEVAQLLLEQAGRRQNTEFLHVRDQLNGNRVIAAELPGHVFGIPVAKDEQTANRLTEQNQSMAKAVQSVLHAPSLNDVPRDGDAFLVSFLLRRLCDLIDYSWSSDSGYFDSINGCSDPRLLLDNPELFSNPKTALAVIDFHF